MYNNQHNKTSPDSHSSVSVKNECAFNLSHWTTDFKSVAKCAKSSIFQKCRHTHSFQLARVGFVNYCQLM